MRLLSYSMTRLILVIGTVFTWGLCASLLVGQEDGSSRVEPNQPAQPFQPIDQQVPVPAPSAEPLRDFHDAQGTVLVSGYFVKLKSTRVVIRNGEGVETQIALASLSDEDQAWIADEVQLRRVHAIAQRKLDKINKEHLRSVTQSKVITGLQRIAGLGKDAPFAASIIEPYLEATNPADVRAAAFAASIAVAPNDDANLQSAIATMINDDLQIRAQIVAQPEWVIAALSTFNDQSIPFLYSVVFTGDVIPAENPPVLPTKASVGLDENQIQARVAAMRTIAGLSKTLEADIREETLQSIIAVVDAIEQSDAEASLATLRASLDAIGEIGIANERVEQALTRYAADPAYAKQVERVRTKLEKASSSER